MKDKDKPNPFTIITGNPPQQEEDDSLREVKDLLIANLEDPNTVELVCILGVKDQETNAIDQYMYLAVNNTFTAVGYLDMLKYQLLKDTSTED